MTRSKIKTASITDDAVTTAKVNPAQTDITSVGTLSSLGVSSSSSGEFNALTISQAHNTSGNESRIRFKRTMDAGADREVAAIVADRLGGNDTDLVFETNTDGSDGATERVRISHDGNLYIGKTTDNVATVGIEARGTGPLISTRDGADALRLNRLSSDGEIIQLRKDGSTVGSVSYSNATNIALNNGSSKGIGIGTSAIFPTNGGTAINDGGLALGYASSRFSHLYLSGSIFIGGTSSVNSIDDVETGSWTVNVQKGGSNIASPNSSHAYYIRVGDMCHFTFYWYKTGVTTSGSDQWSVGPVPFDMRAGAASGYQHIHVGYINIAGDRTGNGNHRWQANTATYFFLYGPNLTVNVSNQSVELSGSGVVRLT